MRKKKRKICSQPTVFCFVRCADWTAPLTDCACCSAGSVLTPGKKGEGEEEERRRRREGEKEKGKKGKEKLLKI